MRGATGLALMAAVLGLTAGGTALAQPAPAKRPAADPAAALKAELARLRGGGIAP